MRTLDAIARILAKEGIERISAFPAASLIESAADIGIRRAGVGMADFTMLAQDEARARVAASFRSGSLNEVLAGLRRGKKAGE